MRQALLETVHLVLAIIFGGRLYYYSHFSDEKTEAHKTGTITCLSLLSYLKRKSDLDLGLSDSKTLCWAQALVPALRNKQ